MPGYQVQTVFPIDERLLCPRCRLLLRHPVQDERGVLSCRDCINESLNLRVHYWPDKAVAKEVMFQRVFCSYRERGCQWEGHLKEYEAHVEKHSSFLPTSQETEYSTTYLPFPNLSEGEVKIQPDLKQTQSIVTKKHNSTVGKPTAKVAPLSTNTDLPHSHLNTTQTNDEFVELYKHVISSTKDVAKSIDTVHSGLDSMKTNMYHLNNGISKYSRLSALGLNDGSLHREREGLSGGSRERGCSYCQSNLRETFTDFSVSGKPPNGSSMQCRWQIQNISKFLNDARKNHSTPLISPVWCTHPCGYCLRAYVFINGYGQYQGTHVSIFFKLVPGPNDDFLPWPLKGIFTFFLLDHFKNLRPIMKTFRSDHSFQRPLISSESDMNIASGCPEFITIDTLSNERYVKDDALVLEFKLLPLDEK